MCIGVCKIMAGYSPRNFIKFLTPSIYMVDHSEYCEKEEDILEDVGTGTSLVLLYWN
jgi:hypothetical protein